MESRLRSASSKPWYTLVMSGSQAGGAAGAFMVRRGSMCGSRWSSRSSAGSAQSGPYSRGSPGPAPAAPSSATRLSSWDTSKSNVVLFTGSISVYCIFSCKFSILKFSFEMHQSFSMIVGSRLSIVLSSDSIKQFVSTDISELVESIPDSIFILVSVLSFTVTGDGRVAVIVLFWLSLLFLISSLSML